jgi:transcriptional regulator with XRE-family HTH domain
MSITGNQLRAARALIGVDRAALAEASGVSFNTIRNMEERGRDLVRVRSQTLEDIVVALEQLGVEFVGGRSGGRGVRLRD